MSEQEPEAVEEFSGHEQMQACGHKHEDLVGIMKVASLVCAGIASVGSDPATVAARSVEIAHALIDAVHAQ